MLVSMSLKFTLSCDDTVPFMFSFPSVPLILEPLLHAVDSQSLGVTADGFREVAWGPLSPRGQVEAEEAN